MYICRSIKVVRLSDGVMATRLILVQKTPGSSPGRTTDKSPFSDEKGLFIFSAFITETTIVTKQRLYKNVFILFQFPFQWPEFLHHYQNQ